MQIINVADMVGSQLELASNDLSHKFWQYILTSGLTTILFVAIWTNTLNLPISGEPELLVAVFYFFIKAGAVLFGLSTIILSGLCLKAQSEVRDEIEQRQQMQESQC